MSRSIESPQFFFRQKETLDALEAPSTAKELVIYCGAGISIDRTNVTWTQLIQGVFRLATTLGKSTPRTQAIAHLVDSEIAHEQRASIVVQAFSKPDETENDFLGSKIKEIIYTDNSWRPGLALRNILRVAMVASGSGIKVTIITTNYDNYIEQAYERHRTEMLERDTPAENVPGMSRWVLHDDGTHTELPIQAAGASTSSIKLIYLHGRVDGSASVEGRIVLSERSYSKTRQNSSDVLYEQFSGPDKAVLMVGASLRDAPLIYALTETSTLPNAKFALVTMPPELDPTKEGDGGTAAERERAKAIGEAWGLRGDHLGVKVLRPLDHFQSAQFLEELVVGLSSTRLTGDPKYYRTAPDVAYSRRLESWYESWSRRTLTKDPEKTFEQMREGLRIIVNDIFAAASAPSGELLRLELWVRLKPRSKSRELTLWATSVGPIVDKSTLRHEKIVLTSRNASVRALLAGRPLLMSIKDLGHEDSSSRWKTFFSAPIYPEIPVTVAGGTFTANLPVGVITLASTRYVTEGDKPVSAMAGALKVPHLTALKIKLIGIGRDILGTNEPSSGSSAPEAS